MTEETVMRQVAEDGTGNFDRGRRAYRFLFLRQQCPAHALIGGVRSRLAAVPHLVRAGHVGVRVARANVGGDLRVAMRAAMT